MTKNKGWRGESKRHSLAARGYSSCSKHSKTPDPYITLRERQAQELGAKADEMVRKYVPMVSYNGHPLTYESTVTAYNNEGQQIGTVKVGRDDDGKLCVEGGKYTGSQRINDEVYSFYQRHGDVVAIKNNELSQRHYSKGQVKKVGENDPFIGEVRTIRKKPIYTGKTDDGVVRYFPNAESAQQWHNKNPTKNHIYFTAKKIDLED